MKVNVLGTEYDILLKKYDEDPVFSEKHLDGYHNYWAKQIVVCILSTHPGWKEDQEADALVAQKETIRHEIVHAFFAESGLQDSASQFEGAWCKSEELVDWIALQGPKIYKAWVEAGAV